MLHPSQNASSEMYNGVGGPCRHDDDCGRSTMRCEDEICTCYWAWRLKGAQCSTLSAETAWVLLSRGLTLLVFLYLMVALAIECRRLLRAPRRSLLLVSSCTLLLCGSVLLLMDNSTALLVVSGTIKISRTVDTILYTLFNLMGLSLLTLGMLTLPLEWLDIALATRQLRPVAYELRVSRRLLAGYLFMDALALVSMVALTYEFADELFRGFTYFAFFVSLARLPAARTPARRSHAARMPCAAATLAAASRSRMVRILRLAPAEQCDRVDRLCGRCTALLGSTRHARGAAPLRAALGPEGSPEHAPWRPPRRAPRPQLDYARLCRPFDEDSGAAAGASSRRGHRRHRCGAHAWRRAQHRRRGLWLQRQRECLRQLHRLSLRERLRRRSARRFSGRIEDGDECQWRSVNQHWRGVYLHGG